MFLAEMNRREIVIKQFFYKMKAYRGVYSSLMVIQLLAILFSVIGTGMSGGSSRTLTYEIHTYSNSMIIAFMMIWAFIISIIVTTKAYRYDDFTFVSNRFTSHMSTILFLLFASIVGGITSFLADYLVKDILIFISKSEYVFTDSTPSLFGVMGIILYLFLFCSFGYVCGMLVQINRIFIILIPAVLFGTSFISSFLLGEPVTLVEIGSVFLQESSFMFFFAKIVLTVVPLFSIVTYITNRMEVRT